MKNKSLATIFAITLIIGTLGLGTTGFSASTVTVKVLPTPIEWVEGTPGQAIGQTFMVSIHVTGLDLETYGLNTWTAGLKWDPNKLEVVSAELGNFYDYALEVNPECKQVMPTVGTWDNELGEWTVAAAEAVDLNVEVKVSDVTLLSVTFAVKDYVWPDYTIITYPTAMVTLYSSVPNGPYDFHTPAVFEDGQFSFQPTENIPPVADFTWTPTFPTAGVDLVTFDGSASYDPDGFPIASMIFDFGDGTDLVTLETGPWITTHLYEADGTFPVTLTVWDVGKSPYYPADSTTITKDITVVPPVGLSDVDVFTVKEWLGNTTLYREKGTGPLAPGSAFMPGETLTLKTYAYYEEYPVMDVNVGFQVNYPEAGSLLASLSAKTDITGHATVSFVLPQAPLPPFGNYKVVSTARFFETDFSDDLEFYVGWIVEITSVTVSPDPVAKGTKATFTVSVINHDPYDAYPVVVTVSAFDKLNQALGSNSTVETIGGGGTPMYTLELVIPDYAWPGLLAYVKANAYTDWPALGGVAYCPETSAYFEIVA